MLRLPPARPQIQQSAGDANFGIVSCVFQSIREPFSPVFIQAIALAPASGFRNWTTGDLNNVGGAGYYWSSSPYASGNANGGGFSFGSGDINPLTGYQRARAFPVRCVQHLPLLALSTTKRPLPCGRGRSVVRRNVYSETIASLGHTPAQVPQSMHLSASIT